jgi:hypothetical protein
MTDEPEYRYYTVNELAEMPMNIRLESKRRKGCPHTWKPCLGRTGAYDGWENESGRKESDTVLSRRKLRIA